MNVKPGIYLAEYNDGPRRPVVMVYGPTHRLAAIPADGKAVLLEIVEGNWLGVIAKLYPLYHGGNAGAMYWDYDNPIELPTRSTIVPDPAVPVLRSVPGVGHTTHGGA